MMNSRKLWNDRFQTFFQLFLRYMRLIANSGLVFSAVFLFIFGSYYYSLLLKQIPNWFPVLPLIAVVMSLVITKVNVRTFLKRADLVFMLPTEERMKPYFVSALIYNTCIQMLVTFLVAVVFAPLYAIRADEQSYSYGVVVVSFLLITVWNVIVHWYALKLHSKRALISDTVLRLFATLLLITLLLIGADIIYLLLIVAILLLYLGYSRYVTSRYYRIKWERLIEHEEQLANRFYKFVNAFVDVPALSQRVKPRRWSQIFTSFIRHDRDSAPYVLYIHGFFRAGQYFGIYIRLLIIGMLVLVFLPFHYGKVIGLVLFVYMTAVQVMPLAQHYAGRETLKLYPIHDITYAHRFQHIVFSLLIVELFLFSVTILITGVSFVWVVSVFIAMTLVLYVYVKKGIQKEMRTNADGL